MLQHPTISRFALWFLAALAIGAALFSGCGGNGARGSGTLTVLLADAPNPTATAVDITLDRVEANIDGTWQAVNSSPQTYNLLELARIPAPLGSIILPSGHYTQVRLFVSGASITDATGTHELAIPSGDQTGIKVNVDYDVNPNEVTGLLLDFNVDKSIVITGNGVYHLQPVIRGVVQVLSGTVTGTVVDSSNQPVAGASVVAISSSGQEINSSTTLADGTFKIWALLPDTYTIRATFTQTSPTPVETTATQGGVIVNANENTEIGTLTLQ